MLKITAIGSGRERTLILEGKLIDAWITELERIWGEARAANRSVVIDLKDVTTISQQGENLLHRMMAEGATLFCCRGVLTRHVVQELERRRARQKGQKG